MKKFVSLILTLALVLSLTINASAETFDSRRDSGNLPWSDTNEVKVVVNGAVATVYYVDVVWKELSFTYNATKTWDPASHTYTDEPGWENKEIVDAIVIKNHSNASVNVSVTQTEYDTNRGVKFSVTTTASDTNLATAVGFDKENPPSISYTVKVTDTPSDVSAGSFKIGLIAVNITAG